MNNGDRTDLSGLTGEQLQAAVRSITADPAFARLLGEIRGDGGKAEAPPIPAVTPEMMAKLPQMMTALAPLVGGANPLSETKGGKADPNEAEKRRKLLQALKPYLSDNRREAVDGIMRMSDLTELLSKMKPPESSS